MAKTYDNKIVLLGINLTLLDAVAPLTSTVQQFNSRQNALHS
jgi:hypothetical protein